MSKWMMVRLLTVSALIALLISCAKINSPSGGTRDKIPPVVTESAPMNGSKNFKGRKIGITFNEYVVLDNVSEKFMISPPMKKKPRVFIRGKNVDVEFDETLKDSTTYTLYFQDAIKDLNEGNILQNYQFVFATGPVIDSLSVTGNIYESNNLEVPDKTVVLLYREKADSAVVKHIPEYITRLDQTGYFRINNVRPGTYRLYSLVDGDNSKNYNLPDEEFAFTDSVINVTPQKNFIPPPKVIKDTTALKKGALKTGTAVKDSSKVKKADLKPEEPVALTGEYKLYQFTGPKKLHYLTSSKRDPKFMMLYVLSLPPDTMRVEFTIPYAKKSSYFTEYSRNRDSLKVWLTDSLLYSNDTISTRIRYPFTDTLGTLGYKQDTIVMRFMTPRVQKTAKAVKVKRTVFTFESNIQTGNLRPGQSVVFRSKTPFRQPDTTKIRLFEYVKTSLEKRPYQLVKDSLSSSKYFLKAKLEKEKKYILVANKGSFGNIYNEYSDSAGIKFSIKDTEAYSKLTFNIKNYNGDMIVQLLDKAEKLIAENYLKKEGKTVFPLLDPGIYRVKIIYDLNGDRKWTTGDFSIKRQPEPVSYYPAEIELKSGFDAEQDWDAGTTHFKDPKLREKKKGK
jgi:hypothetical protein